MKNNVKISKSHKVANKNNNVEHKDPFHYLNIRVPYYNMATVMEGLKISCIDSPYPSLMNLIDSTYDITLGIVWAPISLDNNPDLCAIYQFQIILSHHDKEIKKWTNEGEESNPNAINYEYIQDFINSIVKKDIEEVRNSGKDLNDDKMREWLTGTMFHIPAVSASEVVKKWEIALNS